MTHTFAGGSRCGLALHQINIKTRLAVLEITSLAFSIFFSFFLPSVLYSSFFLVSVCHRPNINLLLYIPFCFFILQHLQFIAPSPFNHKQTCVAFSRVTGTFIRSASYITCAVRCACAEAALFFAREEKKRTRERESELPMKATCALSLGGGAGWHFW